MRSTPAQSEAARIARAMQDLRLGRITPDEYRQVMRDSHARNGDHGHHLAKFGAVALDVARRERP